MANIGINLTKDNIKILLEDIRGLNKRINRDEADKRWGWRHSQGHIMMGFGVLLSGWNNSESNEYPWKEFKWGYTWTS